MYVWCIRIWEYMILPDGRATGNGEEGMQVGLGG